MRLDDKDMACLWDMLPPLIERLEAMGVDSPPPAE
jgi:hypothetical protein